MTALIAAIAARLGHRADQAAIEAAYQRGYCASDTYSRRVIAELELKNHALELKVRGLEIDLDHAQGENYDLEQRLAICDSAVIQLPEVA